MATARDIIYAAMRKIHVLGTGQSPDANEVNDALSTLNQMLSSWSAEGDLIYIETRESFPLTIGQTEYHFGTGQDFVTTRPVVINAAFVRVAGTDTSLAREDQVGYSQIVDKDVGGTPNTYYYDASYPIPTIALYPTPNQAMDLHIYSEKPLTSFADLTTNYDLPPGYEKALIYNLAVELAPEYEREPLPTVLDHANKSKAVIQSANTRNDDFSVTIDAALIDRSYNIYSGLN